MSAACPRAEHVLRLPANVHPDKQSDAVGQVSELVVKGLEDGPGASFNSARMKSQLAVEESIFLKDRYHLKDPRRANVVLHFAAPCHGSYHFK